MRGTDVTPKQMEAASEFICSTRLDAPEPMKMVMMPYVDLVRLVAWYGAIRYKGALAGIGEEGSPGRAEEMQS